MTSTTHDPFLAAIPDRITSVMERDRLSISSVARTASMSRATLERRLKCPGDFRPSELERLASALEVPLMFLFRGEEVGM